MIEINLLPIEMRKKNIQFPVIPLFFSIISAFVLLFILHISLLFITAGKEKILYRREREVDIIKPKLENARKIRNNCDRLKEKVKVLSNLTGKHTGWSEKLNIISNSLPSTIWLRELRLEKDYGLILQGSAISTEQDEMVAIGKFINNLENSDKFADIFERIELKTIQKRKIVNTEIADFNINCQFKKQNEKNN